MNNFLNFDSWYEQEDYHKECECCKTEEEKKEDASIFLKEIVTQIYSKKPIDKNDFENCLDELCHYFDIRLNSGELNITNQHKVFQNA